MSNPLSSVPKSVPLLATPLTAIGAGPWVPWFGAAPATFGASVVGTGAVSATVQIQVSNDGVNAAHTVLGSFTLSGTGQDQDFGIPTTAEYAFVRAAVTAISGTGAAVTAEITA